MLVNDKYVCNQDINEKYSMRVLVGDFLNKERIAQEKRIKKRYKK